MDIFKNYVYITVTATLALGNKGSLECWEGNKERKTFTMAFVTNLVTCWKLKRQTLPAMRKKVPSTNQKHHCVQMVGHITIVPVHCAVKYCFLRSIIAWRLPQCGTHIPPTASLSLTQTICFQAWDFNVPRRDVQQKNNQKVACNMSNLPAIWVSIFSFLLLTTGQV